MIYLYTLRDSNILSVIISMILFTILLHPDQG